LELGSINVPGRRSWELACVFALYLLGGEIGLAVPFTSGNISPLWPPAGIALAAMVILGYRVWPAVALGAFIVNFSTGIPHLAAVGITVGNTVGPLCGAWLLRKLPGFQYRLTRLRDVLGMSVLGALCGTAVSATVGAGVLFLTGVKAWSGLAPAWLMWWFGDAMGVLIVTPLVLTFTGLMSIRGDRRLVEFACLLLGTVVSALAIFDPRLGFMRAEAFAFGVFPFVLWGAIRFEVPGAAIVSFLISSVTVWGTVHGFGPFIKGNALQNATLLQGFLGVTSVSGMVLAAVVSERVQLIRAQSAHEALERSEKSYRGIVETGYEGIWKVDVNFITSFANRRMAELLGYTVEEMLGRPVFDFLFEGDIEQKRSDLELRRRGVSEQLETRYRKKDGSVFWARVASSPIVGEDGAFEGVLAMVSDITEQKRAESEACRSREMIILLSQAVEQTADTVVITDRQGTIEYVNPAFETTTGYRREEAVGKTPRILKSGQHDEDFYSRLWRRIMEGEAFRGTLVNRKQSGELYWAEQTITPIKDSAGVITNFVSVLKDITELRKQQEQELQLRMAREVQSRLMPQKSPVLTSLDYVGGCVQARAVGGDYYDFLDLGGGRVGFVMADISGKGMSAALLMASLQAHLRGQSSILAQDLPRSLCSVNRMFYESAEHCNYATLFLGVYEDATRRLCYANCGHTPPLLLRGGSLERLEATVTVLGLFEEWECTVAETTLAPGDILAIYTDGVVEAMNENQEEFGEARLVKTLRENRHLDATSLFDAIVAAVQQFAAGEQSDDLTLLVARAIPGT
jgi:PAS domain S-box-containing protein